MNRRRFKLAPPYLPVSLTVADCIRAAQQRQLRTFDCILLNRETSLRRCVPALCLASISLCQCEPTTLHTAFENDTGHDLSLRIETRDGAAVQSQVLAGQTFSASARIGNVTRVTYSYDQTRCELNNEQVRLAVDGEVYGRPRVILRPCQQPDRPAAT